MIIYTGLDGYPQINEEDYKGIEIQIENNAFLVIRPEGNNKARVIRLISSDPQMYLRQEYQPGSELELVLAQR
ncbi:MAG: YlzJ-like family protein [Ignavibacteriales bacterium]